jgi:hypothetical protein
VNKEHYAAMCSRGQYVATRRATTSPPISASPNDLAKTLSQVDHSSIVVEELATVARNLHGNTVGVFDVLLPQLLEHAAETVVPSLLFLGGLAWVRGTELHE